MYKQSSIMLSLISFKMNGSRNIYIRILHDHLSIYHQKGNAYAYIYTMKHVPFLPEVLYEKNLVTKNLVEKAIHIPSYMEGI